MGETALRMAERLRGERVDAKAICVSGLHNGTMRSER